MRRNRDSPDAGYSHTVKEEPYYVYKQAVMHDSPGYYTSITLFRRDSKTECYCNGVLRKTTENQHHGRIYFVVNGVLCIVYLTFSCHNITFEIFVISRNLVYHASIRKKLDDAVRSCLYDLMVTAGKQDDTREFDHTIIQCGDGFHIQVVCRLIKDQNVASHDHHAGEKDTDFFSTGEDTHLFYTIFTGKKHTAEETADISCVFDLGVLGQPVNDQLIGIKDGGIILREIRLACCNSPFVRS